jgi:hypothetical protein
MVAPIEAAERRHVDAAGGRHQDQFANALGLLERDAQRQDATHRHRHQVEPFR